MDLDEKQERSVPGSARKLLNGRGNSGGVQVSEAMKNKREEFCQSNWETDKNCLHPGFLSLTFLLKADKENTTPDISL